jgi:hypothetical protein
MLARLRVLNTHIIGINIFKRHVRLTDFTTTTTTTKIAVIVGAAAVAKVLQFDYRIFQESYCHKICLVEHTNIYCHKKRFLL